MTSATSTEEGAPDGARAHKAVLSEEGSLHALKVLADRISDLEALVQESIGETQKLRKAFSELRSVVAKKKHLKKLKKVLDQLEVIEVGEDAPTQKGVEKSE
jgi:hypothetical protein